jgi:hypothetical protein
MLKKLGVTVRHYLKLGTSTLTVRNLVYLLIYSFSNTTPKVLEKYAIN